MVAAGSAAVAAFTYYRNARTKRAEFLIGLHKSFFVDPLYKEMKALLDCSGAADEERLIQEVKTESPDFTDFLNFFELIAYLVEIGTLARRDAEALLGYYLDRLRDKPPVWEYIKKTSSGYECLRRFLQERRSDVG